MLCSILCPEASETWVPELKCDYDIPYTVWPAPYDKKGAKNNRPSFLFEGQSGNETIPYSNQN